MMSLLDRASLIMGEEFRFSLILDITVSRIFTDAITAMDDNYEKNIYNFRRAFPDEEVPQDQLHAFFSNWHLMQTRTLSVMSFAIMEAELIAFLKSTLRMCEKPSIDEVIRAC